MRASFARAMRRFGPALSVRPFRRWLISMLCMSAAMQMIDVIIGWQVYSHQRSALDLGWIGLAEFMPLFILAIPAGHIADRFPRRLVVACAAAFGACLGLGLAAITAAGVHAALPYLAFAVGAGATLAIGTPASRAIPPTLVERDALQSAMTLRSFSGQGAQVLGPAIGGLVYAVSPTVVYLIAALSCSLAASAAVTIGPGRVPDPGDSPARAPATMRSVLEGLRFVRRNQIILGAILLDLLAVLFGGAVSLLPIFAHRLGVGATGLGVLRAGPAIGALLGAVYLLRVPIGARAGRRLLTAVAIYGVCIVVFGISKIFVLSFVVLIGSGFVDMFSMNIRSTTIALATPDRLRGRVGAVEMVFISASNQLGGFESGLTASIFGAVPAVIGGGCMTILIAVSWIRLFPVLGSVNRMDEIVPVLESAEVVI